MRKPDCAQIESLLIQSRYEELSEKQQVLINEHLDHCSNCQASEALLTRITTSAELGKVKNTLRPNPETLKLLVEKIKLKHKDQKHFLSYLFDLFNVKIPVYQILAGTAIIVLLFIIFTSNNSSSTTLDYEDSNIALIDSNAININVSYPINLFRQQKIGRNIKEDSVLASFAFPSL